MDRELQGYLERIEAKVTGLDTRLSGVEVTVGGVQRDLSSLREQVDENRRHADVIAEGLRDDLRGIAEGVLSTNERLEIVRAELRVENRETRTLLDTSQANLRRRIALLEEGARPA